MKQKTYSPHPVPLQEVELSDDLKSLVEMMARHVHDVWAQSRMAQGWKYGERRDDVEKTHPCLVDYDDLPEVEKDYDRNTAVETLKFILQAGFKITK